MSDPTTDDAAMAAMLDLSKKKKKKKKKDKTAEANSTTEGGESTLSAIPIETFDELDNRANYSYEELLTRVVQILHSNNPDLIAKKRHSMKPPQLMRVGTKKTLWVNFQEVRMSSRWAGGANDGATRQPLRAF